MSHSISTVEKLREHLELTKEEENGIKWAQSYSLPFRVTPYYLSLIDGDDRNDPIRLQCIPRMSESTEEPLQSNDPLSEQQSEVAPNLIRRYPDRVLLLVTDQCAVYCRHCTRKRRVGQNNTERSDGLDSALRWIKDHEMIHEVILSGGDPLLRSDRWIEELLDKIGKIPSVRRIRIGSRVPVTLPQRVTSDLCEIFKRHQPIFLVTHFNHPNEVTRESKRACEALVDSGIPVANQSVLLKGVNDHSETLMNLSRDLLNARVRPYYLMQCDSVLGTSRFRVNIGKGLEIMKDLRRNLTGLGIPTYVLDVPGGAGKVVLNEDVIVERDGNELILMGPKGQKVRYFDPVDEGP